MISSMTLRPDLDAPDSDSAEIRELALRTGGGGEEALAELFSRHGERLERMLRLRLSRRLQGIVERADVLRKARAVASRELSGYLENPTLSPFLWLRQITGFRKTTARRSAGVRCSGASATWWIFLTSWDPKRGFPRMR